MSDSAARIMELARSDFQNVFLVPMATPAIERLLAIAEREAAKAQPAHAEGYSRDKAKALWQGWREACRAELVRRQQPEPPKPQTLINMDAVPGQRRRDWE